MMVLAQVLNVVMLKSTKGMIIQHLLRVYVLIFCIMFILAELQFEQFLKLVPPLKNWIYRGFLYSFVGIIGVEESYAALAEEYPQMPSLQEEMVSLFLRITSYAMFTVGLLYIAMGLLCLKGVWEKLKESYNEQVKRSARGDTSLVV
jgi:cytochrome c biogenesis protein CcdA